MKQLKQKLDAFVQKYETPEFIKKDPVQFLHNYNKKQDIEIVGLISSAFAYGRRDAFIEKLKIILNV